jgi:large subunit ribosomal protein L17
MRHQRVINHLGRKSSHRKSLLANLAISLIVHKRISTTTAKARALKRYVEPILTKSKEDSTHSRRIVFSYLQDKEAVAELFREVSPKIADRPGGYTRILKTGNRLGDNAEMCIIELVDFNENMLGGETGKTKTTRRRRSATKKKTDEPVAAKEPVAETKAEEPAAE